MMLERCVNIGPRKRAKICINATEKHVVSWRRNRPKNVDDIRRVFEPRRSAINREIKKMTEEKDRKDYEKMLKKKYNLFIEIRNILERCERNGRRERNKQKKYEKIEKSFYCFNEN